MTDRDIIRAEIERLKECCDYNEENAYDKILSFIDSMEEKSVSEDLEEAAKHHLYSNVLYDDVYVGNPTDKDCIEMFKAGANWQREQIAKESMLFPFKEYDNLMESINKKKKEDYEAGYKQGLRDVMLLLKIIKL